MGDTFSPGLSGVQRVTNWVSVPQLQARTVFAICPFPKKVLGGGFWLQVSAYNTNPFDQNQLNAYAVCANSN